LSGFTDLLIQTDKALLNPLLDTAARIIGQQLMQGLVEAVSSLFFFYIETLLN
jgi:hypothetical protein